MNAKDLAAVSGFATGGLRKPLEMMSSVGPTLNEATFGLLGSSFKPVRDIPDLAGKVIFVTGGELASRFLTLTRQLERSC